MAKNVDVVRIGSCAVGPSQSSRGCLLWHGTYTHITAFDVRPFSVAFLGELSKERPPTRRRYLSCP